jgi:uncharacterized protein
MPEYLSPGVYIEEIEIGAKPIEGVSTSTAGFLGETERGTTLPRLVTSWLEYQRIFGSYFGSGKYLPYAVEGFFRNGGQRCYIARIAKATAAAASGALKTSGLSSAFTVNAAGRGAWGNRVIVKASNGAVSGTFTLTVFYWKNLPTKLYDPEMDSKSMPRPSTVEVIDGLNLDESSADFYKTKINKLSNLISVDPTSTKATVIPSSIDGKAQAGTASTITLALANSVDPTGLLVTITKGTGAKQVRKISAYNSTTKVATVDTAFDFAPDATSEYSINKLVLLADGVDSSELTGTAVANADSTKIDLGTSAVADGNYIGMTVIISSGVGVGQSAKISAYDGATHLATVDSAWATALDNTSKYRLEDKIKLIDYQGASITTPGKKEALNGFSEISDISIVYSPHARESDIAGLASEIISHCENMKDRFAIIESGPLETSPVKTTDSKYAAYYYPWVYVVDPATGSLVKIPPGGLIAGIYARTDTEKGVHKAPANEVVKGVDSVEFPISKGRQDTLNPVGVNCIRAFNGRGILLWGARTMSNDPLWKYINVRRLFLYLEKSIENGTQWVVFEPNNEKLWARMKQTISQFLTTVWKSGALMGTTPEEAFFVKCDRTTMTQDDIDNGRLIVVIGVAPTKPAEFVIFRIAQWQGGSAATE